MEPHNTPKRKACDLCYNKRIKCDRKKPRCSHCIVYESDCTFKAASRKVSSRKPKPGKEDEDLLSRVRSLEAELGTLRTKFDNLELIVSSQMFATTTSVIADVTTGNISHQEITPMPMALPPFEFVMLMIRRYLTTFNTVLPLFHHESLLHMVEKWFSDSQSRSTSIWAAINIVLALAHHGGYPYAIPKASSPVDFLNNAQSVLTPLIMGETELINVQVLLGLVIIFQGTDNLQPANVLIATALSLAHRLRLNFRTSSEHLEPPLSVQRCRVFWMAYVLDRDLSMRAKRSPIQRDDDLDLELPPNDYLSTFWSMPSGYTNINFLRVRVELARIQGKIYDSFLSVQAQNASSEDKSRNVAGLLNLLERWTSEIPQEYEASVLAKGTSPRFSRFFGVIYATRLSCRSLIVQAHLWNSQWIQSLQAYGARVMLGDISCNAPLPQHWQQLVEESRSYMQLFRSIPSKDSSFIWMTICSYLTGLFCLIANMMFYPDHEAVHTDKEQIEEAFHFVDEVIKETRTEVLSNVQEACRSLALYANAIAEKDTSRLRRFVNVNSEPPTPCG